VSLSGPLDHGKTSLLDAIREPNGGRAKRAASPSTSALQGALSKEALLSPGEIVFLDTPGHEAFTRMRARGAKVTTSLSSL